jgi:hypothetical protein
MLVPILAFAQEVATAPASDFNSNLFTVLAPIVTAIIALVGVALRNFIAAHTKSEYLKGALIRLNDIVFSVVKEIEQTVVAGLKEALADGVLSDEEKAKIKQDAMSLVKQHIGLKGLAEMARVFGLEGAALDAMISTKIEAAVHTVHTEAANPTAPSPAA